MNEAKYIGVDVHQATISATVLDFTGKLMMESILETKTTTIPQFIEGLPETGPFAKPNETFPGLAQVV